MDPQTCTHQQTTTSGSDKHQKIITCTQCHKLLFMYHRSAPAHLVCAHVNAWGDLVLNPTSGVHPSTEPRDLEIQELRAEQEQNKRARENINSQMTEFLRQIITMRERLQKAMKEVEGLMDTHQQFCQALRS